MSHWSIPTRLAVLALPLLLSSCVIDETGLPYPVRLEAVSPPRVVVTGTRVVELEVRVMSNEERAMVGPEVRWSTADGSVTPGSGTGRNGARYSTVWTLPAEPGVYAAQAASAHLDPLTFVAEVR